ncbi:MAG: hypothetical protein GY753_10490 [Gammaproteobacteria bacterium]|nr:hypothetical protein [Gammaproteobacteria bacterium]
MQDVFEQNQVWEIINGELHEEFSANEPEPLFQYAIEKHEIRSAKKTKGKSSALEFEQPGIDPKRCVPPDEVILVGSQETYLNRLDRFNSEHTNWLKLKKDHRALVVTANQLFNEVLGPHARDAVLETRREHGLAAAWQFLVNRYTPRDIHLAAQLVKTEWEALRKTPDQSMLDFFTKFHQLRRRMADTGRPPDNREQYDRIYMALLYDDRKFESFWSRIFDEVDLAEDLQDAGFIADLETNLTNKDIEKSLVAKVQASQGTFSSHKKEKEKDNKPKPPVTGTPEAAMQALVAAPKPKGRQNNKTENSAADKGTSSNNNSASKDSAATVKTAPKATPTLKAGQKVSAEATDDAANKTRDYSNFNFFAAEARATSHATVLWMSQKRLLMLLKKTMTPTMELRSTSAALLSSL